MSEINAGWETMDTAPRDGTPFIARAKNGAGHWMWPWLYRHEGKLYSGWEEHVDSQWQPAYHFPVAWLPASITEP